MTDQTPTPAPADGEPSTLGRISQDITDRMLDEHTANDVATLAQLTQEIADRKSTCDEIKGRLRDRLTAGRRFVWQGREVLDLGKPGQQFDPDLAAAVVPAELLPAISTTKPDAAKAKKILPADVYARCCTAKAPAVKTL